MSERRRRQREDAGTAARARLERTGLRPLTVVEERLPVEVRAALVSPGRRGTAGLLLLVAAAVAVAALGAWVARPVEAAAPARPALAGRAVGDAASAVASPEPSPRTHLLVHVVGAVRRPGLVELAEGARVADAVDAAGGPTERADGASVNLARPVVDGEQVVVLRRGQTVGGAAASIGSVAAPGAATPSPVDLNTATMEQLDGLPGIGPVLAQRILDWRQAHGPFTSVDELGEVSGIGETTLAELREAVTV